MVTIEVNGQELELSRNGQDIKYTMQINDIFNIATVNASYTNSFTVPKTETNSRIFDYLGLVGDSSQTPYEKVLVRLLDNGFPVIQHGWLSITETSDNYKLSITDGIIDFFKEIDNKTIGKDLSLDEINHTKNLDTVVESFTNENYKYILADYNGRTQTLIGVFPLQYAINIDHLVPSVRIKYLWDKIFSRFRFTYSGSIFENTDFKDLWLTYPKAPQGADDVIERVLAAAFEKYNFTESNPMSYGNTKVFNEVKSWSSQNIIEGSTILNWRYVIPETGNYTIEIKPKGRVKITHPVSGYVDSIPYLFRVMRGSSVFVEEYTSVEEGAEETEVVKERSGYFYAGEIINFQFIAEASFNAAWLKLQNDYLNVNIYRASFGEVSFSEALADFPIKDFIKEMVWMFGLTPVIDTHNRHITFYTVAERLAGAQVLDWSDKYASRKKETYIQGSYAQVNSLKHKYNSENLDFSDGFLAVNNQNLADNKVLANSRIYSFNNEVGRMKIGAGTYYSFIYQAWEPEPREETDDEGNVTIEIDYKGMSGRFYTMRYDWINQQAILASEMLSGQATVNGFPVVNSVNTVYKDLVAKYWAGYDQVLNDFRCHEIELVLGLADVLNLSFLKLYYFEQEANYYMLNKLSWQSGKVCVGEFIRVKK